MIRTFFAVIGGGVFLMYVAGAMGVGNFYLHYGPQQVECTKK